MAHLLAKMKKCLGYYIDREFQNEFIFKFAFAIGLNAFIILGVLWIVKGRSYNLLSDNFPVLVQLETDSAISISLQEEYLILDEGSGNLYFPKKANYNKPPKLYNAFDSYSASKIITSLLNLFIVAYFSHYFSHRMAGPITRNKYTLEAYHNI